MPGSLAELAAHVAKGRGLASKAEIAGVVARLGLDVTPGSSIRVGDDCAAIPDDHGWLLFAIEGFVEDFVAADPHFAGWCGVMVNLSDIAAMGGEPIAIADAIWAHGDREADPVLAGLRAAANAYDVPIVGGHTNLRSAGGQLAVAVLGRARHLITSFDAKKGDALLAVIDLRGAFREPFPYWDAATDAPAERLRGDLAVLPGVASLVTAGKDISMAGLVGTAIMLLEASGCGARIEVDAVPCPPGVELERFLLAFPSFGFLLTASPDNAGAVLARFAARGLAGTVIGSIDESRSLRLSREGFEVEVWTHAHPLLGCGPLPAAGHA